MTVDAIERHARETIREIEESQDHYERAAYRAARNGDHYQKACHWATINRLDSHARVLRLAIKAVQRRNRTVRELEDYRELDSREGSLGTIHDPDMWKRCAESASRRIARLDQVIVRLSPYVPIAG